MALDYETAYRRLARLADTLPKFKSLSLSQVEHQWLGQLSAIVRAIKDDRSIERLEEAIDDITKTSWHDRAVHAINSVLFETLAAAEIRAPIAVQGSFIPVGHGLDAFVAVGKVLAAASQDIFIIDPYMDATVITDFCPLAPDGTEVRLLTDEGTTKASFEPAVRRHVAQAQSSYTLETRLAPAKSLHDRLILIDGAHAWVLTQSLKDFASRSPGSITEASVETANLKIGHYEDLWSRSRSI